MRTDIYNGGRYLRRWALINGQARCPETALDLREADEALIGATLATNRAVRGIVAAAEAHEAAARLLAGPAPEQWVTGTDDEGETALVENPDWVAWASAGALVAAADAALLHLVRTRADALLDGEALYVLDLPALPAFDPREETADLVDGAWVVRAATEEEMAWHPLRPAAFMPKLAFAELLITTLGGGLGQTVLSLYSPVLALAVNIDWIDVFEHLNGDPGRPGYAEQLLADEVVVAGDVAALRAGWRRACKA